MREFINIVEAKQVGTLYHFTDLFGAWRILEDNQLKVGDKTGSFVANGGMFISTAPRTHVSLTRNPRLIANAAAGASEDRPWGEIRIALNGDKLSQKNHIEPYNDRPNSLHRLHGQAEERIVKDVVDITGCVLSVDFNYFEYLRKSTKWDEWTSVPPEEKKEQYIKTARNDASWFLREMKKLGYKVNLVKKF